MGEDHKHKSMSESTLEYIFGFGGNNAYWRAKHPELFEEYRQKKSQKPPDKPQKPVDLPPPPKPKVVLKPLTCKRCNSSWTPRKEKPPVQCPTCKSPYWNRE